MVDMSWIEVSLTVDGEMAEAVAEVLARFVPDGSIVIESTAIADSPEGEGYPVGPLRVYGYLPADKKLYETRQHLEEALWYLGRIRQLPAPQFVEVRESDWTEAWKRYYKPISIGRSLLILPAWMKAPDPQRIPIRIEPGMAFGTGTHPTTQMCLEMIEDLLFAHDQTVQRDVLDPSGEFYNSISDPRYRLNESPDDLAIIDVGCGSAILSIAALKLGVIHALGVDIDAKSIEVAKENALLNDVDDRFEAGVGSLAEISSGKFSLDRAPLVVANILAPVIIQMLDMGLLKLISPGGFVILSGILADQSAEVEDALAKHGCRVIRRRQMSDWIAYACVLNDLSA